jgi:hypothetical protein
VDVEDAGELAFDIERLMLGCDALPDVAQAA